MNNKKLTLSLLVILLTYGWLIGTATPKKGGASWQPTTVKPYTLTDALGRTLSFDRVPQRVVIAGRASTMVANAVYLFPGISSRIVALSRVDQGMGNFLMVLDPAVKEKIRLETEVGAESIASLHPDVVILKSYLSAKVGKPLESLGLKVVYIDLESPERFLKDIELLGLLFRQEERAHQVVAFYQDRMDGITQALNHLTNNQKPRVAILYFNDRDGQVTFKVPPLSWIQTRLVEMSGGLPVWKEIPLGSAWTQVNLEQIALWDADQIFVISYSQRAEEVVQRIKADPRWQSFRAVKNGQLHAFPADFLSWDQPDVRWILGLQWLAGKLNPALFSKLDMEKEVFHFYRDLYSLEESIYQTKVLPLRKRD